MPPLSSLSPGEADIILNTGEDPVVQRDESTQCLAGEGRIQTWLHMNPELK